MMALSHSKIYYFGIAVSQGAIVMRAFRVLFTVLAVTFVVCSVMKPEPVEARCRWFKGTHNGTDFFYSDGAAGTAEWKVKSMITQWTAAKGIKRYKIRMSKTRCGDWFVKYALPHKHCVAKGRVCY